MGGLFVQVVVDLDLVPVELLLLVADVRTHRGRCRRSASSSLGRLFLDRPTSPPTTTRFVVAKVSQATRAFGSSFRKASRTASEMRSQTLSGWPSETDSEVKT
jgi:hypothetical protein